MRPSRGFTLVELLVVIGIIAVLIGILIPVLSSMNARGRDLVCQSNIRQCVQLFLAYASENRGQLPFGYYWNSGGGGYGWYAGGTDPKMVSSFSLVSRMSSKGYSDEVKEFFATQPDSSKQYAPFLRCPEAQQVRPHPVSYVVSMSAFVTPQADVEASASPFGPPWQRLIEKPTLISRCLPFTALIWDTAVHSNMETRIGHVFGGDIDGQRIWIGATHPQLRFYSTHDPFARVGNGFYGNNRPVQMSISSSHMYRNIDPPPDVTFPYQGNLRFRHRKNTTCNVGYADGHVDQFTGKFQKDGTPISHNAQRKCFMVKWPRGSGIAPDPGLPH